MSRYNELGLAKIVSEKWGTEHHEILLEPASILSDLQKMVWHLDEPYAGVSSLLVRLPWK